MAKNKEDTKPKVKSEIKPKKDSIIIKMSQKSIKTDDKVEKSPEKGQGADDAVHARNYESMMTDVQNSANKSDADIEVHSLVTKVVKALRGDTQCNPDSPKGFYTDRFPAEGPSVYDKIMKHINFV